ncbi:unnamed protein product, partial [Rotaria socialis]
ESMNHEQQEIFYYVREWCIKRLHNPQVEPLRLFITGGAGTGKSHLLKCLHYEATRIFSRKKQLDPDENINEIHTLITAFTGAAAVNVGGVTIHSAFGIGTQFQSLNNQLSSDKLNSYRCKLQSLKLLFVDEVSLIQSNLWGAMHSRLTQIIGVHSNTTIFGNIAIIAIGDFYQCSPVASSSIYSSLLWCDHFEYVELKINERQKTNFLFSQMLNRIRKLKKKEDMKKEDHDVLEQCHQNYLKKEYHLEALHVFPKNAQVDSHNEVMIEKCCTDIRSFYEVDANQKQVQHNISKQPKTNNKPLRLAKNARVMITKNISVNDGLANGVTGRIIDFVEDNNKEVSRIIIKFDSNTVGRIHRINCQSCQGKDSVCVTRESDTSDQQESDFRSRKSTKQFPLRLSWAMTIHKAQGITVDQVVVSTKDMFGTGMGYTALSRVRTLEGLFLIDLHSDKFYCNEKIDGVISQMKQMKKKENILKQSHESINILFHNIEGLKFNFNVFTNHYITQKADLICLTQTWIKDNDDKETFNMNGYKLIHKSGLSSFIGGHTVNSENRGGIAIYFRETLSIKEIQSDKILNFGQITFEIENFNITIILCYRSSEQSKIDFLTNLTNSIQEIGIDKRIFLIGNFNENTLTKKSKPIEKQLNLLGFINIFKNSTTTNNLTSIDCIYSNRISNQNQYHNVVQTFYSFHDILTLTINSQDNISSNNINNESMIENKMETQNSVHRSLENVPIPKRNRKRKLNSRQTHDKNYHKAKLSKNNFDNIKSLKEKQLQFLRNIDILTEKSTIKNFPTSYNLIQQLAIIGLVKISILGDGNCFFRAISHQLHRDETQHAHIRNIAINYLKEDKYRFTPFIDEQDKSIEDYIARMSQTSTYADHLVISATAIVLNKNIIVHQLAKIPILIPGSDYIEHQLHVSYNRSILHYESVFSLDGNSAIISAENLILT